MHQTKEALYQSLECLRTPCYYYGYLSVVAGLDRTLIIKSPKVLLYTLICTHRLFFDGPFLNHLVIRAVARGQSIRLESITNTAAFYLSIDKDSC